MTTASGAQQLHLSVSLGLASSALATLTGDPQQTLQAEAARQAAALLQATRQGKGMPSLLDALHLAAGALGDGDSHDTADLLASLQVGALSRSESHPFRFASVFPPW